MPKEKPIEQTFSSFYKKSAIDLCMFAYVQGVTDFLPGVNVRDAIRFFMKRYNLTEESYPIESAVVTYSKIKDDFIWKDSC